MADEKYIEKIGKVVLDLRHYPGEDLYSEGEAEDMLLDLVTRFDEKDFDHVIQNMRSWSVMYHLSHIRENVLSFLPIDKEDLVLEIGAGCGAVTGALSRMAKKVTCIELSRKRSSINATRHKELDNIEILVGNFKDIEPDLSEKYDYITLIGVLEYAESYMPGDDPYRDFLRIVSRHLKPDGKLIIAIENRFGLKYFAGAKEDHTGNYFEGIEGYTEPRGVRTFSRQGLEDLLKDCGLLGTFYYPYPDYKLPCSIYSDDHLPGRGELNSNIRNFDNDRVVLFDEGKAFDNIIEEGMFPFFSNSFLVAAGPLGPLGLKAKDKPVFAKYSDERKRGFRSATVISKDTSGSEHVFKKGLTEEAKAHIRSLSSSYESFKAYFKGTKLKANGCRLISDDTAELDFIKGISLEDQLIKLDEEGRFEEIRELLLEYGDILYKLAGPVNFKMTDGFREVFGEAEPSFELKAIENADFDMIFSNIVFDKDKGSRGDWNVLDYEWVFDFLIPVKYIIYRALFYQYKDRKDSPFLKHLAKEGGDIFSLFDINEEEREMFAGMEHAFQLYIIGGYASLEVMHERMPVNTPYLEDILRESDHLRSVNAAKLYYGRDLDFSEERQSIIIGEKKGRQAVFDMDIPHGAGCLRFDPTEYPVILHVKEMYFRMEDGSRKDIDRFAVNGKVLSDKTIVYDTYDAQILFTSIPGNAAGLHISYRLSMPDEEVFHELMDYMREDHGKGRAGIKDKVLMKAGLKPYAMPLPEGYTYNR